ncbi:MAG: hypothetical protein ACOCQR_01750 [bacterium]
MLRKEFNPRDKCLNCGTWMNVEEDEIECPKCKTKHSVECNYSRKN